VVDFALLQEVLSNDAEQLSLLPWGEIRVLCSFSGAFKSLKLSDFLRTVGHLELEAFVHFFELLKFEDLAWEIAAVMSVPVDSLRLVVLS
jgi:hypothetical protein